LVHIILAEAAVALVAQHNLLEQVDLAVAVLGVIAQLLQQRELLI
jgi:hypothetical protein